MRRAALSRWQGPPAPLLLLLGTVVLPASARRPQNEATASSGDTQAVAVRLVPAGSFQALKVSPHSDTTRPPEVALMNALQPLERTVSGRLDEIDSHILRLEEELGHGGQRPSGGEKAGPSLAKQEEKMLEETATSGWHIEEERVIASTTACLLLGFVAFVMCLLYVVNFPDPQVQNYAFKLISECISILCAVLVAKAQFGNLFQEMVVHKLVGDGNWGFGGLLKEFTIDVFIFAVWIGATSVLMKRYQGSHLNMYAVKHLFSHEAAFVGIDMLTSPQGQLARQLQGAEVGYYSMVLFYLLFLIGSTIFLFAMQRLSEYCRAAAVRRESERTAVEAEAEAEAEAESEARAEGEGPGGGAAGGQCEGTGGGAAGSRGEAEPGAAAAGAGEGHAAHQEGSGEGEDELHWIMESRESEDESFAIITSLLARQLILVSITGRIPKLKGDFGEHTVHEFFLLISTLVCLVGALVFSMRIASAHVEGGAEGEGRLLSHRSAEFVQLTTSFLVGWCSLSLCRWCVQTVIHEPTLMFIGAAASCSFPLILFIILIDFLCDEHWLSDASAVAFIQSAGLVVGLSWEKAFASAIDTINDIHNGSVTSMITIEIGLCLGLCAVILPGWRTFIVPRAAAPVPPRWPREGAKSLAAD
mmetsp:Transcript_4955/g.15076  ORF Transcript_4955/g.15076 Transcript_4955/m.15076 type:complete len:644 (-) Transcript_4955:44-1975(-)